MRHRPTVLLLLLPAVAQLFLFATLEGSDPAAAGNAFLYYASYLMEAIAGAGPLMFLVPAVAVTFAARGPDLSVAATAALLACLMSRFPAGPLFWWTALPVALLVALAAGLLNGALAVRLRMPVLGITLGTMVIYRGIAYAVAPPGPAPFLMVPGYEPLGYFEATATLMALLYLALGLGLRYTAWGRRLRAGRAITHGTEVQPDTAGPDRRGVLGTFALAGLFTLPAALVHTARIGGAEPTSMAGVEVQALVAALIAGLGWRAGRVSVSACALAAVNLALLAQGMQSLEVALDGVVPFDPEVAFYILLTPIALAGLWLHRKRSRIAAVPESPGSSILDRRAGD